MEQAENIEAQKPKSQKENLTPVQRITHIGEALVTTRTVAEQPRPVLLETNKEFCIICKVPRLNSDPTGLTCGSAQCLSELGKKFDTIKEEAVEERKNNFHWLLSEIAKIIGLNPKELSDDVKENCNKIKDHISGTTDILKSVLEDYLGLEETDTPDDLGTLSETILVKVKDILVAIERVEELKEKQKAD